MLNQNIYAYLLAKGQSDMAAIAAGLGETYETVSSMLIVMEQDANPMIARGDAPYTFAANPNYVTAAMSDELVNMAIADILCADQGCTNEVTAALDLVALTPAKVQRGIDNVKAFLATSTCQIFRNKLRASGVPQADVDGYFASMNDLTVGAQSLIDSYGKAGV